MELGELAGARSVRHDVRLIHPDQMGHRRAELVLGLRAARCRCHLEHFVGTAFRLRSIDAFAWTLEKPNNFSVSLRLRRSTYGPILAFAGQPARCMACNRVNI